MKYPISEYEETEFYLPDDEVVNHLTELHFTALRKFINTKCPMPGHWCNGQPIPVLGRKHKTKLSLCVLKPCLYYDRRGKCLHPDNPKNCKNKYAIRN